MILWCSTVSCLYTSRMFIWLRQKKYHAAVGTFLFATSVPAAALQQELLSVSTFQNQTERSFCTLLRLLACSIRSVGVFCCCCCCCGGGVGGVCGFWNIWIYLNLLSVLTRTLTLTLVITLALALNPSFYFNPNPNPSLVPIPILLLHGLCARNRCLTLYLFYRQWRQRHVTGSDVTAYSIGTVHGIDDEGDAALETLQV